MSLPSLDEYLASLSELRNPYDPTMLTAEGAEIKGIAQSIADLDDVSRESLAALIKDNPDAVPVLGLAVGLSQERLKNQLKHHLETSGWKTIAKIRPDDVIEMLDEQFDAVRIIEERRGKEYSFGDVLVASAGTRATATAAGETGRRLEDEIEKVAKSLDLDCATRTRFEGRNGQTAPCDLAIPAGGANAKIVVAAKGFDSTGSKLTDAVREIEEMAEKRLPGQYVMAAVDGIGWKSRVNDLRRIHELRETNQIDGLYSLAHLDTFRDDLEEAAKRLGLLPS